MQPVPWRSTLLILLVLVIIVFASVLAAPAKLIAALIVLGFIAVAGIVREGFLYLLLAALAFEGVLRAGPGYDTIHFAIEYAMIAIAVASLYFRGERFSVPPSQVLNSMLAFLAWVVFRTLFAMDLSLAVRGFVFFLSSVIVFFVSYQLLDNHKTFRRIMIFQLITAFLFAITGIAYHQGEGLARLSLLGSKPNAVAVHAYIAGAVSLFAFDYFKSRPGKLLSLLTAVLLAFVVLITGSRSAMFAGGIFITAYLWLSGRKKLVVAGYALVASSVLIVITTGMFSDSVMLIERMLRVASGMTMRDQLWKAALGVISSHPLLGVGTACVSLVFSDYIRWTDPRMLMLAHGPAQAGIIHNGYLNTAAQFGLIGAALAVWTILASFRFVFSVRRNANDRVLKISAFLIASICAMLAHGLFENGMAYGVFINDSMFAIFAGGALRLIVAGRAADSTPYRGRTGELAASE